MDCIHLVGSSEIIKPSGSIKCEIPKLLSNYLLTKGGCSSMELWRLP
jgi:hypothetical protein